MKIPFIDLKTQFRQVENRVRKKIDQILEHGQFILGPEVTELEEKLAEFCQVKHAITCSSGTDGLLMSLMALDVGPGDMVFTTPFTFIATAEVIALLGATPVFVDVDPQTYNLDPARLKNLLAELAKGQTAALPAPIAEQVQAGVIRPKGIISVDLFGLPAKYDALQDIAQEYGLFLIEDGAQSFGAVYQGKKACSLAQLGCTSFFPAKPLGCYGDGGAVFTDDDALAAELLSIRVHGKGRHKYDNRRIGLNGRLDTLQAAILLAKLDIFPREVEMRSKVAQRYLQGLKAAAPGIVLPEVPEGRTSVWAQFSIQVPDRLALQGALRRAGIPTAIYYELPLHLQQAFAHLGYDPGSMPVSEQIAQRIVSLPMHPYLEEKVQDRIIKEVCSACR